MKCMINAKAEECDDPAYSFCHLYKGQYGDHRNLHCHMCKKKEFSIKTFKNTYCGTLAPVGFRWSISIRFAKTQTEVDISYHSNVPPTGNFATGSNVYCRQPGQMYNFLTGACEMFTCPTGYKVEGTTCKIKTSINSLQTNKYYWEKTLTDVEMYLSLSIVGLSIICGIMFIATHLLFKELRNRGGLILIGLAVSILISDIFFVIAVFSDINKLLCKISGILLHWSLLTVNLWAIVLAIDLAHSFIRKEIVKSSDSKKDILIFTMVCFFVPVLVVGICVALNETDTVNFNYGANGVCWIGSYYPMLIAYLIPSVVGYTTCIICCISLICFLTSEKKTRETSLKGNTNADIRIVKIARKLVVVLGLIELIGFMQIVKTDLSEDELIVNRAFGLLYAVARSLRGTMLLIFSLVNKKTVRLYRRWQTKAVKSPVPTSKNLTLSSMPSPYPTPATFRK